MESNINEIKISLRDSLYCLGISIFLIGKLLGYTYFLISNDVKYSLILISMIILILKVILCDRFKVNTENVLKIVLMLLAFVICVIAAIISRNALLVYTFIMIVTANNVSFESILKAFVFVALFILIVTMFSFFLGIIREKITIRNGLVRHSFGYVYPTDFVALILYIFLSDLYLTIKNNKSILIRIIFYVLTGCLTFKYCDSRLGSSFILLLIPVAIILRYHGKKKWNRLVTFIMKNSVFICFFIAFFLVQLYSYFPQNTLLRSIDTFSSYRLNLSVLAVKEFGYSWFGQDIYTMFFSKNNSYFFIDSSYYIILIQYGFFVFFEILVGFQLLSKKMYKKRNYMFLIIFSIISFNSLVGQQLYLVEYNVFLLALFAKV